MGTHVIKMPDLGEGIAEVELVAWHVKVGDVVAEDQVLADVMTDKATVEIPSPVVGKVLALGGEVGEVMAVGAELIRFEVAGAGEVSAASTAASPSVSAPTGTPAVGSAPQAATTRVPEKAQSPADELAKRPPAAAPAAAPAAPAKAPQVPAAEPLPARTADRPIASPAVRRRAWELGIDLQRVAASGAGGRILQADLDQLAATAAAAPRPAAPAARGLAERHDEEPIRIVGLRRKIAQKMQESKRRIPHFTYVEEIDVTEIEALRTRLNAKWGESRGRLTLLPLLMRAIVLGVREFPQINARFDDEAGVVTRHGAVHLGIATQTANGLMVPVVRHAEALDLWASAAEVARLGEAARSGKAVREELTGSTITITSLGALGGIVSTPVINHPEVAIVGVNRIVERPVILGGAVVARKMMNLSSSFDHRVVDGVDAARFVQALRAFLEAPATLFVE
jgi:2-oxoisovalerate dehydrogenase E2 component (dihydrolipoyl transacylase)